jgi:DNA-directed RNA polymerase specialized sigma24 family protein
VAQAATRKKSSDNPEFTQRAATRPARRARRRVESDEFLAFTGRIIAAFGRRVGEGDIEAVAGLARLRDELDLALAQAVRDLHARGVSYAEIGARLGVSRQNIRQRFRTRKD